VNRQAQGVVLLLFGGALVKATFTDLYLRYVKHGLQPFLVAAGVLLVVAGVMTLWYELRRPAPPQDHGEEGHAHHEPSVGWLLILPVLGLVLVAPPALGAYAAGQAGTVLVAQSESDYPPLPAAEPAAIPLLDYAARAIFDGGKSMTGRTIALTGFVTRDRDGQPMLTRIVLTCCAADGRPIKIGMAGNVPGVAADTWVRVVGTYTNRQDKDPVNDAPVPYLQVGSWDEVSEPKDPYE
jgi:uncharacterized repeat protein (TIGR03943 family)